jgi:hypothetical protein
LGYFDIDERPGSRAPPLIAVAAVAVWMAILLLCGRETFASAPPDNFAASPSFPAMPMLMQQPALKPQAYVADSSDTATQKNVSPQPAVVPPTEPQPPAQPATTSAQPAPAAPTAVPPQAPVIVTPGEPAKVIAPVPAVPPPANGAESSGDNEAQEAPKYTEKEGPNGKIIYVERPEDSKLILELVLDDRVTVLTSELEAWQVNETTLIPLEKFAHLLRFPIKVDTGAGTASGWFINPENKFSLSAPYTAATIGGKLMPVKGSIIELHTDDIYVSLETLEAWFPVKLTLNYNELRLYMKTLKELPFEAEAKRQAQWENVQNNQAHQPGLDYSPADVIRLPYNMYSAPAIQVTNGINLLNTKAGDTTTTANGIIAQGDLLGMSARFAGNFQTSTVGPEQLTGVTMTLSKEDYRGTLLGPLNATRYAVGDVSTDPFPLAGQQTGRGAVMTNQPYNFVNDANSFRINGFGPSGWDVEVFQNNDLLAFGKVGTDGTYLFQALPLSQGFNLFKIVLYGPNGEQETRYQRFYLGQNMVPAGKLYYDVAGLQSSSPLVDVSATPAAKTQGTVSATAEYGVTNYLSAMAGYFRGPIGNSALDGVGFGLRTSGGSTYAQMNTFYDKSGGQSSSVLITGNLTDTAAFNINHTLHLGYDPGVYTTPRQTSAQISNQFNLSNTVIPSISATLGAERDEMDTGQVKLAYTNRLATNFLGLALSNTLELDTFNDTTPSDYTGTLEARYRSAFGIVHGTLSYDFLRPFQLTTGSVTLQKDIATNLTLNTGLGHNFGASPLTTLTAGVDWKLPKVRLGFAGSIDSAQNKQIGVTATYMLVPQSLSGNYMLSGNTDDLNTGRLMIRPFVDLNGDGIWEAGEPLVQDAGFRNLLRGTNSTPAQGGLDTIGGLTPDLANRIAVDDKSLTDLSLEPEKKQLVVLGRSGVNGPIDYPFSKSGDVSGTLFYKNAEGQDAPFQNVHMQLLRAADGKVVGDTFSEYDGYFVFEKTPVGTYRIIFPPSPELREHYTGDGRGPDLVVPVDKPDISNLKLRIDQGAISFVTGSGAKQEVKNSSPTDQKNSVPTPLPFVDMPINTNKINGVKSN